MAGLYGRLLAICCCLLIALQVGAQEPRPSKIDAPTLKVGDSWTYDRTDGWKNLKEYTTVVVVTEVSDTESRSEGKRSDNGQVATVFRNKDLNRVRTEVGDRRFLAEPYYPLYSFPLETGKSWEKEVTFTRSYDDWKVVSKMKGQVLGWEKVSVPAGTFEALKIVLSGSYNGSGGPNTGGAGRWTGQQSETIWYAPEVRNAVKSVYEDGGARSITKTILELVEYKVGQ
jgi:hypothetical protein